MQSYTNYAKIVILLIFLGMMIYVTYKVTFINSLVESQKTVNVQLAGQSVAIGTLSQCLGCGDQVLSRMLSFANAQSATNTQSATNAQSAQNTNNSYHQSHANNEIDIPEY